MNYNPYYFVPYNIPSKPGLFASLTNSLKSIKWANILNGTQRALNIANQAIPVIKQATPMFKNAKTIFKVMNEFKKVEAPSTTKSNVSDIKVNKDNISDIKNTRENNMNINDSYEGPTFFI